MIFCSLVPNSIQEILAPLVVMPVPIILVNVGVALADVAFINDGVPPPPAKNTVWLVYGETLIAETVPEFRPVIETEVNVEPLCGLLHLK